MRLKLIARRYAEEYIAYTQETIGVQKAVDELKSLERIIKDNPEFSVIVSSPGLTIAEKFEFIDDVLKNYFSNEMLLFLKLLAENRQASLLADIIDCTKTSCYRKEVGRAVIKSAHPLTEDAVSRIRQKLETKLNKSLTFSFDIDKNLIGGVRIELGNTVIDGSVRGRIGELKDEIEIARRF